MYLTNGTYYIALESTGKIRKTPDVSEAHVFTSKEEAEALLSRCKKKTQGYRIDPPAVPQVTKPKKQPAKPAAKPCPEARPKVIRKQYVEDVRRLLYKHAGGHCAICGRPINYNEMTIDHIIPLSSGGPEEVENLQCTCLSCNQLKGDMLPEEFPDKVYTIFCCQMDKKYGKNIFWKIARFFLSLVERPENQIRQ